MEIRKMNITDYDAVYRLWMSCTGMGLNNLDDSQEGIAKFLERNPDTCFVALNDNQHIIGVIMAGNDGRRGYIYHTAVHPDFRKQGIARMLVQKTIDALDRCGIHKVALVVFDKNTHGNLFWERMGFTVRKDLVYRNKEISEMIRIDT
ncbi:MAG TPA: GNAT family N-acetyltransferase [Firmicutes bacterium]|nr:GNAT family N-acetyltransferase [Bacillota bacterium]